MPPLRNDQKHRLRQHDVLLHAERRQLRNPDSKPISLSADAPCLSSDSEEVLSDLPSGSLAIKFPWSSMKKVDMGSTIISPQTFIHVLRSTTDTLVDGFFHVSFNVYSTPSCLPHVALQPVEMRVLTKLQLRFVDASHWRDFILLLRFPVLKDLSVEWGDERFPLQWDVPFFTEWLSHTSDSLERLFLIDLPVYRSQGRRIHRPYTFYTELEALLRTLPKLTSIHLPAGIYVSLPILEDISTGSLLPHLSFLQLATKADPIMIFNMVSFRNKVDSSSSGRCPIKALSLVIPWAPLDVKMELNKKMEELNLGPGYGLLQFLPPCSDYFGD